MALLNEVSLKLIFQAVNDASGTINTLRDELDALAEAMTVVADRSALFKELADSAEQLGEALAGTSDEVRALGDTVRTAMAAAQDGVAQATNAFHTLQEGGTEAAETLQATMAQAMADVESSTEAATEAARVAFSGLSETAASQLDAITAQALLLATRVADEYGGMTDEIRSAMQAIAEEITTINQQAGESLETTWAAVEDAVRQVAEDAGLLPKAFEDATPQVEALKEAIQATETQVSGLIQRMDDLRMVTLQAEWGLGPEAPPVAAGAAGKAIGAGGLLGGWGSKLLNWGITASIGYFGLQSLASAANPFAAIQQLMQQNNQTVQEAAQAYVMLASRGLSGSSAASFLSNLQGQLQQVFTPQVGTGQLSKQALLLSSLGITQQSIAQSPWMLLQTIAERYQALLAQGQGNKAAELLSLTGTSQLAPMLANWQTLAQQSQGALPRMTPQQLDQAVKQGASLQVSLVKLGLAFNQLEIQLVPLIKPLVDDFTKLTKALADVPNGVKTVVEKLGDLALAIAAASKVIKMAAGLQTMLGGGGGAATAGAAGAAAAEGFGGGAMAGGLMMGAETALGLAPGTFSALGVSLRSLATTAAGALRDTLGGALKATTGLALAAAPRVAAFGSGLMDSLTPVLGFLAGPWGIGIAAAITAGVLLATHWKEVSRVAVQTAHAVGNWASHTAQNLAHWASHTGQQLANWAQTTAGHLRSWESTTQAHFVAWAGGTAQAFGHWVSTTTAQVMQWSGNTLHQLGTWTSATGGQFAQWAAQTGAQFLHWSGTTLGELGQWAGMTTAHLTSWAGQTSGHLIQWATTTAKQFGTWQDRTTGQLRQWAATTAQHLSNWARTTAQHVSQWAQQTSSRVHTWASDTWNAYQTWAANVQNNWTGWLQNTRSNFLQWSGQTIHTAVTWANQTGQAFTQWANQTAQTILQWINTIASAIGKTLVGAFQSFSHWVEITAHNFGQWVAQQMGGGAAPPQQVTDWLTQALQIVGEPKSWLPALQWLVQHESGGNPTAVNPEAINPTTGQPEPVSQGGEQATGLLQMLPSTFAEYAQAGMTNILNGLDNAVAAIRYIARRYGSPYQIPGIFTSQYVGYQAGGLLAEPVAGIGLLTGTAYRFGEAGPEWIVPAGAGAQGGPGAVNITVNVTAQTNDPRALAQQVADVLVSRLKRRGNFLWSP